MNKFGQLLTLGGNIDRASAINQTTTPVNCDSLLLVIIISFNILATMSTLTW